MKERRYKLISIDAQLIVKILNWWREPPSFLRLPVTDEIPEGAVVVTVNTNWLCRTIEAIVEHESFDPVPGYCEPPRVPGLITAFETVEFEKYISDRVQTGRPEDEQS